MRPPRRETAVVVVVLVLGLLPAGWVKNVLLGLAVDGTVAAFSMD